MPIEFRCTRCDKLLRTPDDAAGKQAKCPECGAILAIPSAAGAPPEGIGPGVPPPPPPSGPAPGSPFGPSTDGTPVSSGVEHADWITNQALEASHADAGRVSGPAISLIAVSAIGMAIHLWGIVSYLTGPQIVPMLDLPAEMVRKMYFAGFCADIIGFVLGPVVIMGAVRMLQARNYGFAITASILAMLPFFSPCCILGLPIGIWALVVLSDPNVRGAFRS